MHFSKSISVVSSNISQIIKDSLNKYTRKAWQVSKYNFKNDSVLHPSFLRKNVIRLRSCIYRTPQRVLPHIPKHLKSFQNNGFRLVFQTAFSVFGHVIKHCPSC